MNIIKKIVVAATFLCVATAANAQDGIKFGARLGYSMQSLDGGKLLPDEYLDISMGMLGIGAGLVVNIPVGPVVIAPELAFSYREGAKFEPKEKEPEDLSAYEKEFAVSVPIMIKFFPIEALWIGAGFQIDIPIAAEMCDEKDEECEKLDGKTVTETDGGFTYEHKNAERASVDFGIPFGIGYMITPNFGVDFRFVLGLNKLVKREYEDMDPNGNIIKETEETGTMKSFGIGLTYLF